MNSYLLQNNFIALKVRDTGAEMTSLINRVTGLEYLWQAGEAWPKQAPVLFPVVGQLKENSYLYEGSGYALDRHGFARSRIFKPVLQTQDSLSFLLSSDEQSLTIYPFLFQLTITYSLEGKTIVVNYNVENTSGKEDLYFSIGAHPAFKVPLHEYENYHDYFLLFEKREHVARMLLKDGLITGEKLKFLNNENMVQLSKSLFYHDAIVLKGLQSESVTLKSNASPNGLKFSFSGFPYFGIWAAKDAEFLCLEPWHGIADFTGHNRNLNEKEGIIRLGPGQKFECSYSIETF